MLYSTTNTAGPHQLSEVPEPDEDEESGSLISSSDRCEASTPEELLDSGGDNRQCESEDDSMETLLSLESVRKVWSARNRDEYRAREHVKMTGPSAKEAETRALQPAAAK